MVTVTATGHGHRQREGVLPLAPRASCPCVPCIAAQAVARVGVRMAGWRGLAGLRSWWCDGVRGSLRAGCGYPFWTDVGRLGADRVPSRQVREGEGAAAGLVTGTWHLASRMRQAANAPRNEQVQVQNMRLRDLLIEVWS